jgi:hypothetical protein
LEAAEGFLDCGGALFTIGAIGGSGLEGAVATSLFSATFGSLTAALFSVTATSTFLSSLVVLMMLRCVTFGEGDQMNCSFHRCVYTRLERETWSSYNGRQLRRLLLNDAKAAM